MQLSVVRDDPEALAIQCEGEIVQSDFIAPDSSRLPDPLAPLLGPEGFARKVTLDLSGVTSLDPDGVKWLIGHHHRFLETGGQLVIHSIPETANAYAISTIGVESSIASIFHLLHLNEVLELEPDEAAAWDRLCGTPQGRGRPASD